MALPVRKAVLPVAGLGTRFLPATKAVPKEMLTVVDKPVIQYVVDEALDAGIEHLIFVTGRSKAVIEDYFDIQVELEQTLRQRIDASVAQVIERVRMNALARAQAPAPAKARKPKRSSEGEQPMEGAAA